MFPSRARKQAVFECFNKLLEEITPSSSGGASGNPEAAMYVVSKSSPNMVGVKIMTFEALESSVPIDYLRCGRNRIHTGRTRASGRLVPGSGGEVRFLTGT